MKLKTLFDKKHVVITVSVIVILVTVLVAGADVIISGIAVGQTSAPGELPAVAVGELKVEIPSVTGITNDADESTNDAYSSGNAYVPPTSETLSDEEDSGDADVYTKVGEVSVNAGAIVAAGTLNE